MATMADQLIELENEPEIYYSGDWPRLRRIYQDRRGWFDGDEWKKEISNREDSEGNKALKWPLQVNPIAKVCRIHRGVMLGVQEDTVNEPPVKTIAVRTNLDDLQKQEADRLEQFVNGLWYDSLGVDSQMESALLTQFYGGHVFQLRWEPWNQTLRHRIGIRSYKSPSVFWPKAWDPVTFELLDCYIGYEISADYARAYYKITTDENVDNVLYLEHWTREEYKITVDGKVLAAEMDDGKKHEYAGPNLWGTVPIVYAPHERHGLFWGRSLVDDDSPLIGLSKEINARLADKGDAMQDAMPVWWAHDTRTQGWVTRDVRVGGKTNLPVLDIGNSSPVGREHPPELKVTQSQGLPATVAGFPEELNTALRAQADVAAVAYGEDDVSGGRITGPVTAFRMLPTTLHTQAERSAYHTALIRIAHIARIMALTMKKTGGYKLWGAQAPAIEEGAYEISLATQWRPMLPIENSQKITSLNERLTAGGISLVDYLREIGSQDPEAEAERIWEDRTRQAEIEAEVQATVMEARVNAMGSNRGGNHGSTEE